VSLSNRQLHKADIPGFIIERTAKRMRRSFKQVLLRLGAEVTIDQWALLYELDREEGLSQLELATRTFKDAPTVTRIIDKLCAKRLTERRADPEDRRRFGIYLTTQGHTKIQYILPAARAFREKVWDGLEDKEVEHLTKVLNKVFKNLE
jgi:DNA-binding MarR family transcriptional regulator